MLHRLRDHYSTENLDRSIRLVDELKALEARKSPGKDLSTWQRLQRQRLLIGLSAGAKAMWTAQRDAEHLHEELEFAREFFDLAVRKEQFLTTLLSALHAANQLQNPTAVSEGRDIFDRLNTGYYRGIAEKFDLSLTWEDSL